MERKTANGKRGKRGDGLNKEPGGCRTPPRGGRREERPWSSEAREMDSTLPEWGTAAGESREHRGGKDNAEGGGGVKGNANKITSHQVWLGKCPSWTPPGATQPPPFLHTHLSPFPHSWWGINLHPPLPGPRDTGFAEFADWKLKGTAGINDISVRLPLSQSDSTLLRLSQLNVL